MPIQARTFHVVVCDVCGDPDADHDVIAFYDLPEHAADAVRRMGWLVTADHLVICPSGDEQHRAAIDALLPPEPRIEIEGQLHLDLDSDTTTT